ncbi:MAG: hypothetical protein RBT63_08875 [Bdellovibrionales bacterium]|jgi:hypothetical protein|nr:hypothetical protein [Bdellovibrionales bacterium]
MSNNKLALIHLDEPWANRLSNLRVEAYSKHGGSLVNPTALRWGMSDERYANIAIIQGGEILAALRFELHRTQETLAFSLQQSVTPNVLPAALTSRAATVWHFLNHGGHRYLRMIAIETARTLGLSELYCTYIQNENRTRMLRAIGYMVEESSANWSDFLQTKEPIALARLDVQKHGESAAEKLRESLAAFAVSKNPETAPLLKLPWSGFVRELAQAIQINPLNQKNQNPAN